METTAPIRTFLACALSDPLRSACEEIIRTLQKTYSAKQVYWTSLKNLHLTVRFLGNITEDQRLNLKDTLPPALQACSPFQAPIGSPLVFPPHAPHVIALPITLNEPLALFYRQIETIVQACGLLAETRPFSPHVTLGRLRIPKAIPLNFLTTALPQYFDFKEIALYKSVPKRHGRLYTPLFQVKLHSI